MKHCPIKVVVNANVPAFNGGYLVLGFPTSEKRALCGTDHGYSDALDRKLETLRRNLRDTYGVEPKGDQ